MVRTPTPASECRSRGRGWTFIRIGLQDRLLLSVGGLVAASVLFTSAAAAEHSAGILAAAAGGAAETSAWQEARGGILRGVGGTALAALAFMLPLVYFLISRTFKPLRQLSRAARLVAEGHFEQIELQSQSGDAMGELVTTFNAMVTRLREQKKLADDANASLIQTNLDLESIVDKRAEALEATAARLRREIDEKGDFFRAVSHDLNAPLRNIDGMVASIARKYGDDLPDDAKRRLERVRHNVQVEAELINEVLELSRIKTVQGEREDVLVASLIWDLRNVFEQDLRDNGIDLLVESEMPTLRAERARLRQVFQNLIDNAIKYMGDGERRVIRIGCTTQNEKLAFYVTDTGIGISEAEAEKVFYAFRRGTNHGAVAGKGVGLAGVKAIIETYDGTIRCRPGDDFGIRRGTTFDFTIDCKHLASEHRETTTPSDGIAADEDALQTGIVNEDPAVSLAAQPRRAA